MNTGQSVVLRSAIVSVALMAAFTVGCDLLGPQSIEDPRNMLTVSALTSRRSRLTSGAHFRVVNAM